VELIDLRDAVADAGYVLGGHPGRIQDDRAGKEHSSFRPSRLFQLETDLERHLEVGHLTVFQFTAH
jgi:hypothetical protein